MDSILRISLRPSIMARSRFLKNKECVDVLDLGKDVSGEEIVSAALANDIKLIGLSALMTTTALNMGDIIKLIREKCPERRVMVGGAALSQEFADKIGADFYGKDAIASAKYALSVFGEQQKP